MTTHGTMTSADEGAFLAGRDLAVEALRMGVERGKLANDVSRIEARYREGPQDLFFPDFVTRLQQEPELMAGFCAVLSDYLCECGAGLPECYAELSLGQMLGPKHDASLQRFLSSLAGT